MRFLRMQTDVSKPSKRGLELEKVEYSDTVAVRVTRRDAIRLLQHIASRIDRNDDIDIVLRGQMEEDHEG